MNAKDEEFEETVGIPKHAFFYLHKRWVDNLPSRHPGPDNKLSPTEQVFVLFMYLRHYTALLCITMIFSVSRGIISQIIDETLDFFDNYISPHISMSTLESRLREAIYFFSTPITFLIDGTEQKIHSFFHIFHENNFFSTKKKQHSITILIIMSLKERILFLFICYYGSVVDKQLMKCTKHEWAPCLTIQEWEFADTRFDGQREKYGLNIYTPLHPHQHPFYKMFSFVRIRIENKIHDFKIFEYLAQEVREPIVGNPNLLPKHTKRWRIVGGLINAKMDDFQTL